MSEIADLLKGPRGTQVQVVVQREGVDKPITFNIIRDEIPRSSVPDAMLLKPGIAYVNITAFNENTSKEFDDKLKKLGEKDIKGLVLDLRENPGGLLNRRRRRRRPFSEEERSGGEPSRPHRRIEQELQQRAPTAPARIIRWWCW